MLYLPTAPGCELMVSSKLGMSPFFGKFHVKQALAPWAKPYASFGHLSMSLSITSTDHRLAMAPDRMNRVPRLPRLLFRNPLRCMSLRCTSLPLAKCLNLYQQ
jgi:hypothetical protein